MYAQSEHLVFACLSKFAVSSRANVKLRKTRREFARGLSLSLSLSLSFSLSFSLLALANFKLLGRYMFVYEKRKKKFCALS